MVSALFLLILHLQPWRGLFHMLSLLPLFWWSQPLSLCAFCWIFFFSPFFWPHPWHVEVPGTRIKSECSCDLCHKWKHQILNLLHWARDPQPTVPGWGSVPRPSSNRSCHRDSARSLKFCTIRELLIMVFYLELPVVMQLLRWIVLSDFSSSFLFSYIHSLVSHLHGILDFGFIFQFHIHLFLILYLDLYI